MVRVKCIQVIIQLSFVLFLGCGTHNSNEKENLSSTNWFDKFGNEYKFGTEIIEWKPIFGIKWWKVGKYEVMNAELKIYCSEDSTKIFNLKIISRNEERIILEESLRLCESPTYLGKERKDFEIWRNKKMLVDKQEKLISLKFKARPQFIYSGIRNFSINQKKQAGISLSSQNTLDSTFVLNDNAYNNIEHLIQILPLEKLNEEYHFGITDGVDFNIEIQTNKLSKNIKCRGGLPEELINLIQHINYELK